MMSTLPKFMETNASVLQESQVTPQAFIRTL